MFERLLVKRIHSLNCIPAPTASSFLTVCRTLLPFTWHLFNIDENYLFRRCAAIFVLYLFCDLNLPLGGNGRSWLWVLANINNDTNGGGGVNPIAMIIYSIAPRSFALPDWSGQNHYKVVCYRKLPAYRDNRKLSSLLICCCGFTTHCTSQINHN